MKKLFQRLFGIQQYIKSSFVIIRIGEGAGITVYKANTDEHTLKRVAAQFFKIAYRL